MIDYVVIGHGVVGRGVVAHLRGRIVIIDQQPTAYENGKGQIVQIVQACMTEHNFVELLEHHSAPGTIVIETANHVGTADVVAWCHANGRHFVNTVSDIWHSDMVAWSDGYRNIDGLLYRCVEPLFALHEGAPAGPTSVMMQGANTGMVNHYFRQAIRELAASAGETEDAIGRAVREVYILEKDTLCFRPGVRPEPNVFYNTWNIKEFIIESAAFCEFPEKGARTVRDRPLQRDVFLDDVVVKGRLVPHEETFTMAYCLEKTYGNTQASVQFLYEASPIGVYSRMNYPFGYEYTERCVTDEVERGYDLVGTLIVLDDGRNWFTGYRMENAVSRRFFENSNATAWYVSAGVLAAVDWIRAEPNRGILFPEFADNAAVIDRFLAWGDRTDFISRPIASLFVSPEYDDIAIANLFGTGERVFEEHAAPVLAAG
jgi:homospermidine synthase